VNQAHQKGKKENQTTKHKKPKPKAARTVDSNLAARNVVERESVNTRGSAVAVLSVAAVHFAFTRKGKQGVLIVRARHYVFT
jgi:hypothetical protein